MTSKAFQINKFIRPKRTPNKDAGTCGEPCEIEYRGLAVSVTLLKIFAEGLTFPPPKPFSFAYRGVQTYVVTPAMNAITEYASSIMGACQVKTIFHRIRALRGILIAAGPSSLSPDLFEGRCTQSGGL